MSIVGELLYIIYINLSFEGAVGYARFFLALGIPSHEERLECGNPLSEGKMMERWRDSMGARTGTKHNFPSRDENVDVFHEQGTLQTYPNIIVIFQCCGQNCHYCLGYNYCLESILFIIY